MKMTRLTDSEISALVLKALDELSLEDRVTEETLIYGQSSAIESFELVTALAEIEASLEARTSRCWDIFELLLENQQEDLSVACLSRLIAEKLDAQ
jgi:hypothetical protein